MAEENADDQDRSVLVNRRTAIAGTGVLATGALFYLFSSRPALAAEGHEEWVAQNAEITAHDGSVDGLTFGDTGDDNDELHLSWSGFNADDREANFRILVRGDDDGDEDGWNNGDAGAETDYEELAGPGSGVLLDGTSGSDDFTWSEAFGEEQPVDVDEHNEIDVPADFSEQRDGETRDRELTVDVEVWIDEEDGDNGPDGDALGDRQEATATISVTNQDAEIEVGGQGTFELESDEEVDD